jgi:hypothetical protein
MPSVTAPSSAPSTSLSYITIGAIMAVLAGTSCFFFDGESSRVFGYIRTSFLVLGIVLVVIGFTVGHIGRAARKSELPPGDATHTVVRESQTPIARGPATQPAAYPPQGGGAPAQNTVVQT